MCLCTSYRWPNNSSSTVRFKWSSIWWRKKNWPLSLPTRNWWQNMPREVSAVDPPIFTTHSPTLSEPLAGVSLLSHPWWTRQRRSSTSPRLLSRSVSTIAKRRGPAHSLLVSWFDRRTWMSVRCRGGHGRTGTIVSIVIGILFNLPSNDGGCRKTTNERLV